jgi:hypothetical protein
MNHYKSYYLKSLGLREESLPEKDQPDELNKGIAAESTQTKDLGIAKKIAEYHIESDPEYYSNMERGGMGDSSQENDPPVPRMSKLMSPTARPSPVIAIAVRGTKSGLLPAGGIVGDPEKARLGGLELVKNVKPNSQGAIANTPSSPAIKSDGGHFTPDNAEITKKAGPVTSVEGDDNIHPMQVQQLGNKPFEDDGTSRDGEHTPVAAGGNEDDEILHSEPEEEFTGNEEEGPWGIPMKNEDEPEEVEIDVNEAKKKSRICQFCKQGKPCKCDKYDDENQEASDPESPKFDKKRFGMDSYRDDVTGKLVYENHTPHPEPGTCPKCGCGEYADAAMHGDNVKWKCKKCSEWYDTDIDLNPATKSTEKPFDMKERFQKLANIPQSPPDAVSQLREVVGRLKANGKVSPLVVKAESYLSKLDSNKKTELDKQSQKVDKTFGKMEKDPNYRPFPFDKDHTPPMRKSNDKGQLPAI